MEMENHHQYGGGISDLRQFISIAAAGGGATHFPTYGQQPQPQQQPSLLSDFMTAHNHHPYNNNNNSNTNTNGGMVVMGRHMGTSSTGPHPQNHYQDHFNCDSATTTTTATTVQGNPFDCGDGGTARWPRQETLTLLEIRSRLDHKFKEANQKGPLWDEVARIMCEEHGYQRSGKKCREKFENLYKYYKKTKEGKAGRQDGKHYRFFRQLEALYGEHHHPISTSEAQNPENAPQFHNTHPLIPPQPTSLVPPPSRGCDTSVSLSNSSNFDTSSSDDEDGSMESNGSMETQKKKKKKKRRGHSSNWKAKIKEFIDLQMMKIMEKQESWLEKMMNTLENRENERMIREEEWRKQEVERVEREHKFWASERAWIEARDSALMAALEKLTNNNNDNNNNNNNNNDGIVHHQWPEHEVTRLIQVRTSMESRFQQCGFSEEVLWEDIATKMAYLGYDRSAIVCKEKWDNINNYFRGKSMLKDEGKKKRKENYGGIIQHHHHNLNTQSHNHSNEGGIYMNQLSGFNNCEINEPIRLRLNEGSSSPSSHNSNVNANTVNAAGNVMNDSCLRFFLGDHGESNLGWESNYGLKLNNGDNHCS